MKIKCKCLLPFELNAHISWILLIHDRLLDVRRCQDGNKFHSLVGLLSIVIICVQLWIILISDDKHIYLFHILHLENNIVLRSVSITLWELFNYLPLHFIFSFASSLLSCIFFLSILLLYVVHATMLYLLLSHLPSGKKILNYICRTIT